ncbi:Light-harvesting complex [Amphidinium carterae]|mmetsp:Transcript_22423/g.49670  ORF Transcript_22423/g.49670 Transcript_22423/m.49670 type:complete len:341 (-) Transcript_22423:37-1059(-)
MELLHQPRFSTQLSHHGSHRWLGHTLGNDRQLHRTFHSFGGAVRRHDTVMGGIVATMLLATSRRNRSGQKVSRSADSAANDQVELASKEEDKSVATVERQKPAPSRPPPTARPAVKSRRRTNPGKSTKPQSKADADARRRQAVTEVLPQQAMKVRFEDLPQLIPFIPRPRYQQFAGNTAGDAGFDPYGFSNDVDTFNYMRLAELKHARWAMLAALGWPMSEVVNPPLASLSGLPSGLLANGTCPAFLNGGWPLAEQVVFVGAAFCAAAVFDYILEETDGPGRYGWDPIGLENLRLPLVSDILVPMGRNAMADAEILNGRVAMIAISIMVIQEFVTEKPVL